MPATETRHTPEHWARNFAAYISELDAEEYVAELAALKARADQAERMAAVLREALPYLQHLATTAPVGSDAERVCDMIEAELADSPPAR